VDGEVVDGPGPNRALVFQNFVLLPWATVLDNAAFGLEARGMKKEERHRVAAEQLARVGLVGFENHYPRELSGGMQQRVGIARALAVDPANLLMDEPFGALDALTRQLMQKDLLALWQDSEPRTAAFVTHSMDEAVFLSDRVVLMTTRPGRIEEVIDVPFGRPRQHEITSSAEYNEFTNLLWSKLEGMQRIDMESREGEAAWPLMLRRVMLPAALPLVVAGIRLAAGRAVKGAIIAEQIVGLIGLGGIIQRYGGAFAVEELYAAILFIGVGGALVVLAIGRLERRVVVA